MTTAVLDNRTTEYDVQDVEYLRHGDKPLLARVFTPRGQGPFPALVECHGGAWCLSDRKTEHLRHEFIASHGIVSIALDFRSGTEAKYPASAQDINYAVRWAKLHAGDLKTKPELVGISGQSSGGHLAMLVAMRPHDARYAAIALPAGSPRHDASVRCAVLSWPVINPLVDLSPFIQQAGGSGPLLNYIGSIFLHGSMTSALQQAATDAVNAASTPKAQVQAALYVVLTSGEYQIIH